MANTYSWTINKLDVRPTQDSLTDVVYNVHFTYTATSNQTDSDGNAYTSSIIGTSTIPTPDADNFTDFDSLTQSNVEGWLEAELTVSEYQSQLNDSINEKITPTSETKDVPW